jgi:hypothetical protein
MTYQEAENKFNEEVIFFEEYETLSEDFFVASTDKAVNTINACGIVFMKIKMILMSKMTIVLMFM